MIRFAPNAFEKEPVDYSQYPTTTGMVLGTEDFNGDRWLVRFKDAYGNEFLAMDDQIAKEYFHPERHHAPKKRQTEHIYYWPYTGRSRFGVNYETVTYEFHFCDETLYGDTEKADR